MKNLFKPILLLITLFLFVPNIEVKASHIMGGEMTYEYIGFNSITGMEQYRVCVFFYRDMTGINCPPNVSIRIWEDDDGNPLTAAGLLEIAGSPITINQSGTQIITQQLFPPGCGLSIGFDIELCEYCDIIELPPSLKGYHITTGTCCRNSALDNLVSSSSTWYTFIPPTYYQNSSPSFTDFATPYLCACDTTTVLNTATDPDGDLLIFSFSHPLNSQPFGTFTLPLDLATYCDPVTCTPFGCPNVITYSIDFPFGPNGYIDINASTGLTTFMACDTASACQNNPFLYVVAIEVREYRNGILIGIVKREIQFVVIPCPPSDPPLPIQFGGCGQNVYNIEEGDSLCFCISGYDLDGDTVYITGSGFIFDSLIVNPPAVLPEVWGDSIATTTFCWKTECGQGGPVPYLFNVTLSDSGCPPKATNVVYTINVLPYQGISQVLGEDTLCANETAVYTVDAFAGGSVYSWEIVGGIILTDSTSDTITVQWADTTQGLLSVSEVTGCNNDTIRLTVKLNIVPADAGTEVVICLGDSIQLSASGGFAYAWSYDSTLSDTNIADPWAKPVVTTTYTVFVTDSIGCIGLDSVTIFVNPPININVNTIGICLGDSAVITVTDSVVLYLWWMVNIPPDTILTDTISGAGIDSSSITVNPSDTTDYYITAFNGACYNTDTITVNVNVPALGPNTAICFGDTTTLNASGGNFYSWDSSTTLSNTSIADPLAYPDTTTTYTVIIGTIGGGCFDTLDVIVTVNPLPEADAQDDIKICFSESIQLLGTGAGTGGTYSWSPCVELDTCTIATPVAFPDTTTEFILTVTDSNGCVDSDSMVLTVNPELFITVNPATICAGESAVLTITGAQFYSWKICGQPDTISTDSAITVSPADTAYYCVTASDGLCERDTTITVNVNIVPTAEAGVNDSICKFESTQLSASGGSTYSWSPTIYLNNPNIQNPLAGSMLSTTTYFVTVGLGNGCFDTDSVIITVFGGLSSSINDSANAVDSVTCNGICDGSALIDAIGQDAPFTYSWDNGETTPLVDSLCSGVYTVTVTDTNNCTDTSTITFFEKIKLTDVLICNGIDVGVANITVNGGTPPFTYLWSDGQINGTASGLVSGTYLVTAWDKNGCFVLDSIDIPATTISTNYASCKGAEDGSAAINISGGIKSYFYFLYPTDDQEVKALPLSVKIDTNIYNTGEILSAGMYIDTLKDANGCMTIDTFWIDVDPFGECNVWVPNAFTPDGDGINDILYVRGRNIVQVKFTIYNRWGEKVFEMSDVTPDGLDKSKIGKGWDGTKNGKKLNSSVFVYYLDVKFTNKNKRFLKGDVTLIR